MKTYIDGLKKALEILEANECESDGYHYCSQQDTYKNLIKAEIESLPFEAGVIKKNAGIERLKQDCLEAQKKYDECWEDQPFDDSDEKFTCARCGGMLYIEQGGDIVDCTSCGATGVQKPERIFNAQKFGEWIETNPFFYFDENEEDYKDDGNESIFSL